MLNLKKPVLINEDTKKELKPEELFEKLANDFTDKPEYTKIALQYYADVKKCSEDYENKVPKNIKALYSKKIDEEEKFVFSKIYKDKFVPIKGRGRKYYDIIIANAKGVCPICGCTKIKNLDHFLPISKYPLLCVTPMNLVPTCRDCNMDKNSNTSFDYYEIPFNPYFDRINDLFLKCCIEFMADGTLSIEFNSSCYSGDPNMQKKYKKHMEITDLNETYRSEAVCTINSEKGVYRKLLKNGGKQAVLESLNNYKESADQIDINSWRSAFYSELCDKIDSFCEWLSTPDT